MSKTDVHTRHGCKYGDYSCTVFYGVKEQEYACEECSEEHEVAKENLDFLYRYCFRLERENKLPREYRNLYNELLALKLKL